MNSTTTYIKEKQALQTLLDTALPGSAHDLLWQRDTLQKSVLLFEALEDHPDLAQQLEAILEEKQTLPRLQLLKRQQKVIWGRVHKISWQAAKSMIKKGSHPAIHESFLGLIQAFERQAQIQNQSHVDQSLKDQLQQSETQLKHWEDIETAAQPLREITKQLSQFPDRIPLDEEKRIALHQWLEFHEQFSPKSSRQILQHLKKLNQNIWQIPSSQQLVPC